MSTKTTFKRIALVAVAALGFGMLSVVPSFATPAAGDVTALTVTTSATSTVLTVVVGYTAVATTTTAMADSNIGLVVVASPDSDLTANTSLKASVTGLVGVTSVATNATTGTKTYVFATKVSPSAGLYQFRAYGILDGTAGTTDAAVVTATGNYNPPILTAVELGSSTATGANAIHRVKSVALTVTSPSGRIGTKVSISPSYLAEGVGSGDLVANVDKATLVYALTKPTGSTSSLSASTEGILQAGTSTAGGAGVAVAASVSSTGTAVTFTPDVAGTYTLTAFDDANGNLVVDSGEATASKSVVISANAPLATLTVFGSTSTTGSTGALVRLALTNGGVAASMGAGDSITITTTNTGAITEGATITSVDSKGYAYVHVTDAAAEATTVTFTGTGTLATLTASTSITFKTAAATVVSTVTTSSTTTTATTGGTTAVATTESVFNSYLSAATTGLTVSNATDLVTKATYTDGADGCITGSASKSWTVALTYDTTTKKASAPAYAIAAGCTTSVPVKGTPVAEAAVVINAQSDITVNFKAAAPLAKQAVVTPASLQAVKGATLAYIATIKDQFGVAKTGVPVTVTDSSSSRNYGSFVTQNLVTDANGQVTWSVVDAPLTASTGLTSDSFTVAVAAGYAVTNTQATEGGTYTDASITISWVTAISAAAITVGSDDYTAGAWNGVNSPQAIQYGSTGVQAVTRPITAVVRDINGALVAAGVPVTFSVAGTGAAILSTKVTVYTDATGTATSSIYGWLTGTYTVTAAIGTVKATATETFNQANTDSARVLSVSVSGARVTTKVVDRFGNPVSGVTVYALATGNGYFGSGTGKTSDTTGTDGSVYFVVTGGEASVTVSLNSFSAPAGSVFGQSAAAAGFDYDSTYNTATAMTLTTVGTALVAEKGVGASYAPAGVASAKVAVVVDTTAATAASDIAQAAVDAASEATDAANAATDAANAAAEAADAATAAAQDAADAVAALSVQVASLIADLKAQISAQAAAITALTNLIIKIQKKVKA